MVLSIFYINKYVDFVSRCSIDPQYATNIQLDYNKNIKRKYFKPNDEVFSVLHFVKSSNDFLKWIIKECQQYNKYLFKILVNIDNLGDMSLGDIDISIQKTPSKCIISNQDVRFPRVLCVKNNVYSIHEKYIPFVKSFYILRYCYQYITKVYIIPKSNPKQVINLCCDILQSSIYKFRSSDGRLMVDDGSCHYVSPTCPSIGHQTSPSIGPQTCPSIGPQTSPSIDSTGSGQRSIVKKRPHIEAFDESSVIEETGQLVPNQKNQKNSL